MKQFNKHAESYQARKKIQYPDSLYQHLLTLNDNQPHEKALDIGCGNGVSTVRLAEVAKSIVGTDLGGDLIENARKNYPEIEFLVTPSEELSFPENTFSLVTSATSFYWMDRVKVLDILAKVIQPGGVFCAYKYDFPYVYGEGRKVIEREMFLNWGSYRKSNLLEYDNTLELMQESGAFSFTERRVFPNIVTLSVSELVNYLLSMSFVTRYLEENADLEYGDKLKAELAKIYPEDKIKVNLDIHSFIGKIK